MPRMPIVEAFTHKSEVAVLQIDTDNFLRVAYNGVVSEAIKIGGTPAAQAARELLEQLPEWQRRH